MGSTFSWCYAYNYSELMNVSLSISPPSPLPPFLPSFIYGLAVSVMLRISLN